MKFRNQSSFSQCDVCQELKAQCLVDTSDSLSFALLFTLNLLAFEPIKAFKTVL